MDQTLHRQQEALVIAIKDLQQRETKRLNRLANVKSRSEHQSLHERFERERQQEKERVEHLMSDYFAVEQKLQSDDVRSFLEERKTLQKTQHLTQREDVNLPNRFEGIESHTDIIFHSDIVKKFEKHDKRFQARINYVPYDPVKEDRKLRLLNQKKDLLQNLIKLQSNACAASGDVNAYQNTSNRRYGDTHSITSGSSSGASYATFASSNIARNSSAGKSKNVVPRLRL